MDEALRSATPRRTARRSRALAGLTALLVAGCALAPAGPSGASGAPTAGPTASAIQSPEGSPQPEPTGGRSTPSESGPLTSWTRLPTTDALRGATMSRVLVGPEGLLAIGGSERAGLLVWTSDDGIGWVGASAVVRAVPTAALALPDGFVVLGKIGDGSELERAIAWQSSDGRDWQGTPIDGLRTNPTGVGLIGDRIATFALRAPSGGEPTLAWSSGNLMAWTSDRLGGGGFSNAAGLAVLSDGTGLAFGRWSNEPMDTAPFPPGQAACWRSRDGRVWQRAADDPDLASALIVDAAQRDGGAIVAVGQVWNPVGPPEQAYALAFWASSDGESWDRVEAPPAVDPGLVPEQLVITPSGYLLLASPSAGGSNSLVAASADGRTWAAIDPAVSFEGARANDLAVFGERLIAVGQTLPTEGTDVDAAVWIGPMTNVGRT